MPKARKKPSQLVSFGFKPKLIVRIDKEKAATMNFKSPNRLKASDRRMADLVKQVVAALGE